MEIIKTPDSSNIAQIGYDANTKELVVTFKRGGAYSYKEVPQEVFQMITQAESVGKAFHSVIKQGGYEYEKLGGNIDTMKV